MLVFDIESDNLLPKLTKIHCINIKDSETGEKYRYNDTFPDTRTGTVAEGLGRLKEAPEIGGHNVHDFDVPAIQKVYPEWTPKGYIHDSLPYCRLIWPDIKDRDFAALHKGRLPRDFQKAGLIGSHSLKAWGHRLGEHKGDPGGSFETFTREMDDYCAQDVEVNTRLFEKIASKDYSQQALRLENDVAAIIARQVHYGFLLDVEAAEKLYVHLQKERLALEEKLCKTFQPWYRAVYSKGSSEFSPKADNKRRGYVKGAPFCRVKLTDFNPGSRDHIANRLYTLFGWRPQAFTETGKPKVDETTLTGLTFPEAKLLKTYLMVVKRLGQVGEGKNAWLKKVGKDSRIHGRVNSNGAVTGRMTHSSPNVAQVPSVKQEGPDGPIRGLAGEYGYECRSLFTVPAGMRLVGCDAEGLELRCLGHYMARWDGGAYAEAVVNGDKTRGTDVHTKTQKTLNMNARRNAKTWMYCYLYGGGNHKAGTIVLEDYTDAQQARFYTKFPAGDKRDQAIARLGKRSRKKIAQGFPALSKLEEAVKNRAQARGFLVGLDGRKLPVRHQHAALNTLLQSAGALVMKQALVAMVSMLAEKGLSMGMDYKPVANVHDEVQIETQAYHAETVGKIAARAIRQAGETFNFRCELSGSYDVGTSWASTH